MQSYTLSTRDGKRSRIPADQVEAFGSSLRGEFLTPESAGYEAARTVWNAMIDRRPALIARCAGEADVIRAVEFARSHALLVAVQGGGHNIAGLGVCDGGLLIDLSPMRAIHIDPAGRTAQVEPGCTLRDFDHDAQIFGLATPVGINSTTGISGLTLGGGFGWLSRKHGLTADNLLAAEVVTAAGRVVRTSAEVEPDLFWALRADETDRVRASYGPCYDRLVEVKSAYDPENLFRMNHNIKPGVFA